MAMKVNYERDGADAPFREVGRESIRSFALAVSPESGALSRALGGRDERATHDMLVSTSPDGLHRSVYYRYDDDAPARDDDQIFARTHKGRV